MKSPHGHAEGVVIRHARLRQNSNGKQFVEAVIEMGDARQFRRGDYRQRVDICTEREDEIATVSLIRPGVRVRVEGDIDWTAHKDGFGEGIEGRVRITGSITILS